jgi:hypothetical protein
LLRGLFAPYGVRLIENEEVLDLINNNHVVIHRSSSIIPDLLNFKLEKHEMAKKLYEDVSKHVVDEIFFADVDHEYILAPMDVVLIIIKEKIYNRIIGTLTGKITKLRNALPKTLDTK